MSFRQLFVVAVISFAASAAVVAQMPFGDIGSVFGLLWDVATGPLLPFTVPFGILVVLGLYFNPSPSSG